MLLDLVSCDVLCLLLVERARLSLIDVDGRLHSQMQEQSVQALEDKLHEAETTEGNVCGYARVCRRHMEA